MNKNTDEIVDDADTPTPEAEETIEDILNAAYTEHDEDGAADADDIKDGKPAEDPDKTAKTSGEDASDTKTPEDADKTSGTPPADDNHDKAPINLSPELREGWKDLDPKWQKHMVAREAEVNQSLEESKNERVLGKNFTNMVQPYIPLMQAEGANSPLHAIEELMKNVQILRNGNPQDKAEKIAHLMNVYSVDVGTLDSILTGAVGQNPPGTQPLDPNMAHMIDKRMEPVNQLLTKMNQNAAAAEETNNANIRNEIQTFATVANDDGTLKHEFYNDVRNTMADFMDVAAKNGVPMTMEDAYHKACAINPGITEVMETRAKNNDLMTNANNMQKKRAAAGSLAPDVETPSSLNVNDSMHAAIEDAWDEHTG